MTNEVANTGSPLPAFLQAALASSKPSADVAALATAQNSTPRLSLRGKVFRFVEGATEVYKSSAPIQVHILGAEPGAGLFCKTFYKDPYAGADSSGNPPDCSSADGIRPDPWISQPVHSDCKSCPKNQFGSATSRKGKAAKACHDSKRMMIVRADDKDPTPIPERTLYLSQIPVTSLRSLSDYGKKLAEYPGFEPWMAVTQLAMDEEAEYPTLVFSLAGFIQEQHMPAMKERAAKREWLRSRDMMLQNQPARQALPAHLQQALGGGAAASAAPAMEAAAPAAPNNLAPPSVVMPEGVAPAAAPVDPNNLLKNW